MGKRFQNKLYSRDSNLTGPFRHAGPSGGEPGTARFANRSSLNLFNEPRAYRGGGTTDGHALVTRPTGNSIHGPRMEQCGASFDRFFYSGNGYFVFSFFFFFTRGNIAPDGTADEKPLPWSGVELAGVSQPGITGPSPGPGRP